MKKLIILATALTVAGVASAASPSLRIYSGIRDTLRTESTILVAVTDPGATASVNGNPVHVYKTGSFGTEIALQPGINNINISVTKDGATTERELSVFRAEPVKTAPAVRPAHDPEATVMFSRPCYVATDSGAYLQYGNGDDRLGGSKMGFLDRDIVLEAIGQKGSLYCIRLAGDRIAYIPKEYTHPSDAEGGVVNTGSWSITNTGRTDRVTIALPRRLPYQYMTDLDPSTITVDIFGATDNSNWMTQRTLELGMIDYYDFRQIGEDVYRVILRLKDPYQWGFDVHYEGTSLVIDVRHTPKSLRLKDLVIGLDAGHGGPYPGAISPSGLKEKDVNLDIIRRINTLLTRARARTVLTRDGDTGPSMTERKQIWARANVDIAVSVHNNSGGSPLSSPGTAILYKHLFDRPLAECMTRRMLQTGLPLFGIVGNFNFSLNGPTLYPNVLIEGMFMSSLQEEEKLADPDFRQLVAEKIVAALQDYLTEVARSRR